MSGDTSKIPPTRVLIDNLPTEGSQNPISSNAVATALKIAADETAKRATADASGNDIEKTYAKIRDVIFYEET